MGTAAVPTMPDAIRGLIHPSDAAVQPLGATVSACSSPLSPFPGLSFSPRLSPGDLDVAARAIEVELNVGKPRVLFKLPCAPKKPPMLSMRPAEVEVSSSSASEAEEPPGVVAKTLREVLDLDTQLADPWSVESIWKCMQDSPGLPDDEVWCVAVGDRIPECDEARRFVLVAKAQRLARRETFAAFRSL